MSSKTISLKLAAYERLRSARRYASESFSEVVLRATWPEDTVTGRALLARLRKTRPWLGDTELDAVARAAGADREGSWNGH